MEKAILAGGCFWGMEDIIRKIPGVLKTEVGYTGGHTHNPTYKQVCTGETGHAEAILIEFDPGQISFETLLKDWFFKMHDPTTINQQGNDRGSQYRSAIFTLNEKQKITATEVIHQYNHILKVWPKPLVTEVVAATEFYPAEDYHQDYLEKNIGGYTCHYVRRF